MCATVFSFFSQLWQRIPSQNILIAVKNELEYFHQKTLAVESDSPDIHQVAFILQKILSRCEATHSCPEVNQLRKLIISEFDLRKDIITLIHKVACFLCPSTKNLTKHLKLTTEENEQVTQTVYELLSVVAKDLEKQSLNIPVKPENIEVQSENQVPIIVQSAVQCEEGSSDELGDDEPEQSNPADDEDPVKKEFEKYKDLVLSKEKYGKELKQWKKNPSLFWCANKREFPLLAHLWRRIGPIKGSSSAAERIFSLAGFILMARRWNMKPASVNAIVLQHNWNKT